MTHISELSIEEKFRLIQEVGEEIVTEGDLRDLLKSDKKIIAYDGFEPSGQIHIAQAILRVININKLTQVGITFKVLVADWHALANNKMGGDLENIQTVGKYFIEVWKAAGIDTANVEFIWGSDLVKNDSYWQLVLQIARTNGIRRFVRTAEIMGREESMDLTLAQLMYPAMQVADIFTLNARIAQLGMDQRKVNMLAREIGPQLGYWKPVSVSHHMLIGLGKPVAKSANATTRAIELKMSKSKPDTAIFVTDNRDEIERKIMKAWCPESVTTENPILEYCKYLIFEMQDELSIERPHKFGGTLVVKKYNDLEKMFADGKIHPMDLKKALIDPLNTMLDPIRNHFENDDDARVLLAKVQSLQTTR